MSKLKFLLIASTIFLGFSNSALAGRVTLNTVACLTEELHEEVTNYFVKKDYPAIDQLVRAGQCIWLRVGTEVSVISPGIFTATIRYKGVKLFTDGATVK